MTSEEARRAETQRALAASLRQRFAEGPRLRLPLTNAQFEFNPNQVTPIEGLGSVYQTLTIRDDWGELRAQEGALIASDFQSVTVPEPDAEALSGPGWRLELASGFAPQPADATGARAVGAVSSTE